VKARTNFPGEFSSGWDIEVIREPEELERVRPLWERLQWNPYYDIDWLRFKYEQPWCKETPHVFVMKRNGRPETIVAGEIKPLPIQFQIGYKRWQGPSLRTLFIHRYGIMGPQNEEFWSNLGGYLEWMLLYSMVEAVLCRDFDVASPLYALDFVHLPWPCRYKTTIVQEHWYLRDEDGIRGHRRRHKNFWRQLKKSTHRIKNRLGEYPQVVCYREPEALANLLRDTEEVAQKTWQRRLRAQSFTSQEVKDRYTHFLERGLLKGHLLYINDGLPMAFFHGIEYVGKFYAEVMGYDPDHKQEGVGTYLMGKLFEILLENHDQTYTIDFGVGNSQAKSRYCDSYFSAADRYMVAPTSRAMTLNTLRVIFLLFHLSLKRMLAKGGLYRKVRSAWRYGRRD